MAFLALVRSSASAVAFAAGLAVAAYGLALVWLPVGIIFGGAALTYTAVLYERGKLLKAPDAE